MLGPLGTMASGGARIPLGSNLTKSVFWSLCFRWFLQGWSRLRSRSGRLPGGRQKG